jgi:hypothetical protein
MNFEGFHPFITLFFGACCKRGGRLYMTTVPSCCNAASFCNLSATLQTISNTVANLQENWTVFPIFIALLRFSFESLLYKSVTQALYQKMCSLTNSIKYYKCSLLQHVNNTPIKCPIPCHNTPVQNVCDKDILQLIFEDLNQAMSPL